MATPTPPPRKFWQDYSDLDDRWRPRGVRVDLEPSHLETDTVELWIATEPEARGQGLATAALVEVTVLADIHHVTLRLVASPTDSDPDLPGAARLAAWYAKHGFVPLGKPNGGTPMRRPAP